MGKKNLFSRSRFRFPPGYRFNPTDIELVMYYLKRKVLGKKIMEPLAISEVDIYKYAPWDLQHESSWCCGDLKWYFFCPAKKKYPNGDRMKRSTDLGFWKSTGKDRAVKYNKEVVGMVKTLVFHRGKAPKGTRTNWVIYEYRLEDKKLADEGVVQDSYVLCMLFEKEGPGPKNGAQYGAPFREEDWENDGEDEEVMVKELNSGEVVYPVDVIAPTAVVPVIPVLTEVPHNSTMAFAPCLQQTLPSTDVHVPEVSNIDEANLQVPEASNIDEAFLEASDESPDEIDRLLAAFSDGPPFNFDEATSVGNTVNGGITEADQNKEGVLVDGDDIFSGLGDLNNTFRLGNHGDFLEILDMSDPMDCQPHPSTNSFLGDL